jgi:hypothetical protein
VLQSSDPPEKHRIMKDNKEIVLKFTAEYAKQKFATKYH